MSESVREYRRALALHCLAANDGPMTAGDLVEAMGVAASTEGHPSALWRVLDAPTVIGILRSLVRESLVVTASERHNARHGRPEPLWSFAERAVGPYLMPLPPAADRGDALENAIADYRAADAVPGSVETIPEDQPTHLPDLLKHHDEICGVIARFMREVQDTNDRLVRRLAAKGVDLSA